MGRKITTKARKLLSSGHQATFCSLCGKKIPKARLRVLPLTDLCVSCASKQPNKFIPVLDEYETRELLDTLSQL
jgi:RNA polymerase-binding transcription factor DksA